MKKLLLLVILAIQMLLVTSSNAQMYLTEKEETIVLDFPHCESVYAGNFKIITTKHKYGEELVFFISKGICVCSVMTLQDPTEFVSMMSAFNDPLYDADTVTRISQYKWRSRKAPITYELMVNKDKKVCIMGYLEIYK